MKPRLTSPALALALCTLVGGCAEAEDLGVASAPVVGGKPVSSAGPTVALVDEDIGPFCSGVLILDDRVVTAAHCVDDLEAGWIEVVVGDDDLLDGVDRGVAYPVHSIALYPHYRRDFDSRDPDGLHERHDLAVLQLVHPVVEIDHAVMVPEMFVDEVLRPNQPLVIAGYGATEDGGDRGRLTMAQTPFVRRRGGELLAGGAGHADTCGGDSGGPAFVDLEDHRYLVGITSRAATQGCGNGGIYTLAPQYEWWMLAPESAPDYVGEEPSEGRGRQPDDPAADMSCGASGPWRPGPLPPVLMVAPLLAALRRRRHEERL